MIATCNDDALALAATPVGFSVEVRVGGLREPKAPPTSDWTLLPTLAGLVIDEAKTEVERPGGAEVAPDAAQELDTVMEPMHIATSEVADPEGTSYPKENTDPEESANVPLLGRG